MLDLVGKPKDRVCRDAAYFAAVSFQLILACCTCKGKMGFLMRLCRTKSSRSSHMDAINTYVASLAF